MRRITENKENDIIEEARYYVDNKSTIRETALHFGRCKSTIHNHFRKYLPIINKSLYDDVLKHIEINTNERYLRGGLALKKKLEMNKNVSKIV